jgi:hypothetical protein
LIFRGSGAALRAGTRSLRNTIEEMREERRNVHADSPRL